MVSGPDIITYIGVPLAVLGVLPIIYNTVSTLATLSKVRRILRRGRLAGVTRGDVINHVIEVELPRYTIAPLDRIEQEKEYWRLHDHPSEIPGGSWTIFHWKTHSIGQKTQRIDYADQLRQPQAEIGFEELVGFLLDLGAVPDPVGFRMLRGSGLWAPAGTRLLLSPNQHKAALSIAPLDDSDGNLSLSVNWSSDWGTRDQNSLPPYWVRIRGVPPTRPVAKTENEGKEPLGEEIGGPKIEDKDDLKLKYAPATEDSPPAIRCQIGIDGLISAIPDDFDAQMFDHLNVQHLEVDQAGTNTTGVWFASVITAHGTSSQTILWNYKIPSSILNFAKKSTIPCGILVLLGLIEESATPEWATHYNDGDEKVEATFRRMREDSRAAERERAMSPAERAVAFRERTQKRHDDWVEGLNKQRRLEAQREETRMVEALQSPKWDNKLVSEHQLTWLKEKGYVDRSHDLRRAVEVLLWRMVSDHELARDLAKILDGWLAFVDNGGMRKADYMILKQSQVMFAFGCLFLAIIEDSVTAAHGSLAMDLQECLRVWKRVRLG
ncbi:hypothetical protein B7494_g1024 [Chlorociboria aeruginascens]|nr:hypothetical protein B7494_g1024 [Chlorociboria aeruginascens]